MIPAPYHAFMRGTDGTLYPIAWAPTRPGARTFAGETIFRSSRYDPFLPWDDGLPGEVVTESFVPSRLQVPPRVCGRCHVGEDDWFGPSGWPFGTPPVEIGEDGWPVSCEDNDVSVQSVGLAMPPQFVVSGSPVVSRGVLSADWATTPANKFLGTPAGGGPPDFIDPPGGVMLGKLTSGPTENPNCQISAVAGTATTGQPFITGISSTDILALEPGMVIHASTGFPVGTQILEVSITFNKIKVNNNASGSGSVTFDAVPLHYEWVEQTPNLITSAPFPKPGGIVGTLSTGPAKNVSNVPILADGQDVLIYKRGDASGIPVYEYELLFGGGSAGLTSPVPISAPAVGVGTPPAGDPALTTPGNLYVQPTTNLLVFVDIAGNPQVLLLGESGVDVPLLIDIDYTMFSGSSNTTIDLLTLAPKQYIRSIAFELTSLWTYSFGGTSDIQIGYDNADLTPPQNLAFFGQFRVMQGGTPTPIHHVAAGPNPGPLSANTAASWKLQATLTGFLGAPLTGHLKLWAWIGILP